MRVVEANDLEPALARRAPAIDVICGIDQKPRRRRLGDIPGPHRIDDIKFPAQQ